jgi:hypothetical protein
MNDMIEVLKSRLVDGLTIVHVKELYSKYTVTMQLGNDTAMVDLWKTCKPGDQDDLCDRVVWTAMSTIYCNRGDFLSAKVWLDKLCGGNK